MRIDEDKLPIAPKAQLEYALGRWVVSSLTIISDHSESVDFAGETTDGDPWHIQSPVLILQNNKLAQKLFPFNHPSTSTNLTQALQIPDDGFGAIEIHSGRVGWIPHDVVRSDRMELVETDSTVLHYVDSMLERSGCFPVQLGLEELFAVRIVPSLDDFDDTMPDWT